MLYGLHSQILYSSLGRGSESAKYQNFEPTRTKQIFKGASRSNEEHAELFVRACSTCLLPRPDTLSVFSFSSANSILQGTS